MLVKDGQWDVRKGVFGGGEDKDSWIIASLGDVRSRLSFSIQSARAQYIVLTSPTARNLPLGLSETLVTALILSLEDQARGLPPSGVSLDGDPLGTFKCGLERIWDSDRDRGSGVVGGVD